MAKIKEKICRAANSKKLALSESVRGKIGWGQEEKSERKPWGGEEIP
ncbi:MAG: hypothetical protein J1E39_08290 [Eubacterium sp.]|nr:hypothetical protein [Eubacterium sp.]